MAKSSSSSPLSHTTDAEFRTWGSELSAALDSLGLFPKSADSGQINWTTVTRASAGNFAGYEIRYLNDSLNATAPVYVKIEFGTAGAGSDRPMLRYTIGKGSNGSGTITSQFLTANNGATGSTLSSTSSRASYYCAVDGFVGFLFKYDGLNSYGFSAFILQRTVDDSGAPTADGITFFLNRSDQANYAPRMLGYNYATGAVSDSGGTTGGVPAYTNFPPGAPTAAIGSPAAYQMYVHRICLPDTHNLLFTVSAHPGYSLAGGTTFQCAPVGTTQRTYIVLPPGELGYSGYDYVCMLWE
ncbi:hypothetical protein [Dyella sp. 2RAB6]|uniref:hypothetical protein n=1 Tax=Dyella sp. 2RAB6 TaxID=3232992 RepID=UPI003F920A34